MATRGGSKANSSPRVLRVEGVRAPNVSGVSFARSGRMRAALMTNDRKGAEMSVRHLATKTHESVELATLEWVPWFNHHRLMEPPSYIPAAINSYDATLFRSSSAGFASLIPALSRPCQIADLHVSNRRSAYEKPIRVRQRGRRPCSIWRFRASRRWNASGRCHADEATYRRRAGRLPGGLANKLSGASIR